MSFLNPTGVTTLWSRMMNYLTGSHVKTEVVSGATDVDGALTKLQTKTGTAALTTQAKDLSGAVNELNSGLDAQSQQIDALENLPHYADDGEAIDISSYTLPSYYECPCDGYARVSEDGDGILLHNKTGAGGITLIASDGKIISVFIRKGSRLSALKTSGTNHESHKFIKLV